jgi:hypothetical protein
MKYSLVAVTAGLALATGAIISVERLDLHDSLTARFLDLRLEKRAGGGGGGRTTSSGGRKRPGGGGGHGAAEEVPRVPPSLSKARKKNDPSGSGGSGSEDIEIEDVMKGMAASSIDEAANNAKSKNAPKYKQRDGGKYEHTLGAPPKNLHDGQSGVYRRIVDVDGEEIQLNDHYVGDNDNGHALSVKLSQGANGDDPEHPAALGPAGYKMSSKNREIISGVDGDRVSKPGIPTFPKMVREEKDFASTDHRGRIQTGKSAEQTA